MVASEAWKVHRPEPVGAAAGKARPRGARPTTVASYFREIEAQRRLAILLSRLPARERQVLRWRFGLAGGRDHTLEQIGGQLGLSRERVRQIESTALARLQAMAARERPPRALREEGVA